MTISVWWIALAFVCEAIGWLTAYVLIIRTGFRDKIHAMPVIAMIGNIAWEFMLGLGSLGGPFLPLRERFPACPESWVNCPEPLLGLLTLSAALLDVGIAYFIIRYGQRWIQVPEWVRKNFRWLVPAGIATAFVVFTTAVNDLFVRYEYPTCEPGQNVGCVEGPPVEFLQLSEDGGFISGAVLAIVMAMLFINFIYTRPNLEGQSFWIALGMAFGNTSAFVAAFLWTGMRMPPLALVFSAIILTLNYTYVFLYVQRAKEIGIDPYAWNRKTVPAA